MQLLLMGFVCRLREFRCSLDLFQFLVPVFCHVALRLAGEHCSWLDVDADSRLLCPVNTVSEG